MTDRDADFYQHHKHDPSEWAKPVVRSERRRLAAMISARFSPEEERGVREVAERRGKTLSTLVRDAVLKDCGLTGGPPPDPSERPIPTGAIGVHGRLGGFVVAWSGSAVAKGTTRPGQATMETSLTVRGA